MGCDDSSTKKDAGCSNENPCDAGQFCDTTPDKPLCITDYCAVNSDVCGAGRCKPNTTIQQYSCICNNDAELSEDKTTCNIVVKTPCETHDCGSGICSEVDNQAVCTCNGTALLDEGTNICETVEVAHAYDIMAMSWHATFCSNPSFSGLPECLNPSESSKTKLILHGMWPMSSHHQSLYYCGVSDELKADDTQYWLEDHRLPEPDISAETLALILEWMPGTMSDLDRHEWTKHGTCSELLQEEYYLRMIDFAKNEVPIAINNKLNQAGVNNEEINRTEFITFIQENTDMTFKLDCKSGQLIEIQFIVPVKDVPVNLEKINPVGDCGTTFTVSHF